MIGLVLAVIAGIVLIGVVWELIDAAIGKRLVRDDERRRHARLMAELRRHRDD
jgi:hypothetical protein